MIVHETTIEREWFSKFGTLSHGRHRIPGKSYWNKDACEGAWRKGVNRRVLRCYTVGE